jgi:hypothetical protein
MPIDYSLPKPTPGTSRATSPTETEILTDISDTVADVGSRLDTLEAQVALLGTMPIISAGVAGLTTSLATVGGSWWRLDPADWDAGSGTLEYRVLIVGQGLTSGDVLGGLLYDADAAAAVFAEFTGTADGDSSTSATSAWQTFPATPRSGYVQVRNQTAARGTLPMACIQVRRA